MAKFSMKKGGKEVGPAAVYAKPHTMKGKTVNVQKAQADMAKGSGANDVDMSVGNIARNKPAAAKTSGIQARGTGAATKGKMARGPMA
jgi:hypothetical protein